ncbi:hypothetical protein D9619_007337 [Psilocybe cf. subviscida]|uniref:Uncharacterized protein n=1 Tax=Psilocybe cf. subviscida TaxID=2480587 RepID=A0A8H5EWN8_9AGAR|nr:hypothetical protein D9619_007337 [Psilocybe cf. subviscida]
MSSTHGNSENREAEALFASVNKNYPLWSLIFEKDLINYYEPDPPLDFYVGANDTNLDCSHSNHYGCHPHSSNCHPLYPSHHPHYLDCYHSNFRPDCHDHPHYLNSRHVMAQIKARYQTGPFAPHLMDWISLEQERDKDVGADVDEAGRKRKRNKMGMGAQVYRTGMYCANGNVMVKWTVFGWGVQYGLPDREGT